MINLGNIEIADLRLGQLQAKSAWLGDKEIWSGEQPAPTEVYAVCFENVGSTTGTIGLAHASNALVLDLQQSSDGVTWITFNQSNPATVAVGEKVYIRAGETGQTTFSSGTYNSQINNFNLANSNFKVSGNILYLLKQNGEVTISRESPFYTLFKNSGSLVDASEFILPAPTVVNQYNKLFSGCSALTAAPALPATTLTNYCYANMFENCVALTTAPALPATTMKSGCYQSMFQGCTSLTAAPELSAQTLATTCYRGMFTDCTSLTIAPELPVAVIEQYCYMEMFKGCTSLTAAPALPATNTPNYCYNSMFYGCTNLSSVEVSFTQWQGTGIGDPNSTTTWLSGVAATGTFKCPTALGTNETIERGANKCPVNWTVVNTDAA